MAGRGERVVHHQHGAHAVRLLTQIGYVHHLDQRVAGRLAEDHPRVLAHVVGGLLVAIGVEPGDLHTELLQQQADLVVGAVDIVEDDELVPGAQVGQEDHGAGGHAGGADDAVVGLLQGVYALLDEAAGGVVAVIGVAVYLAVDDLAQHLEGEVLVVDGLHDGGDHRPVAVRGQGVGHGVAASRRSCRSGRSG